MRVDDPAAYATNVTTPQQAARAAAALEAEVSLGARPESWYGAADDALADLLRRFPTLRQLDVYRHPPSLSPAARRELAAPPLSKKLPAPVSRRRRTVVPSHRVAVSALAAWRLARRYPTAAAWCVLAIMATIAVLARSPVLFVLTGLSAYLLVRRHRRQPRRRRRPSRRPARSRR